MFASSALTPVLPPSSASPNPVPVILWFSIRSLELDIVKNHRSTINIYCLFLLPYFLGIYLSLFFLLEKVAIPNLIIFINTGIKKLVPLQRENLLFNERKVDLFHYHYVLVGGKKM